MKEIDSLDEFNEIISGEFNLIYFYSSTCNVCVNIKKKLSSYENTVNIYSVNVDKKDIASQYLIFTVPAVIIFSCKRELLRNARFIDFQEIKKTINLYAQ